MGIGSNYKGDSTREFFGVTELYSIFTVMIVIWVYTDLVTHRTVNQEKNPINIYKYTHTHPFITVVAAKMYTFVKIQRTLKMD